jgi:hypothetical protein
LSGFNSQLAVQVNNTRADIRAAKDRLREEARRSVQAQQSLVEWSKQVESERQLLFEAMAYINDDVHAQHPNLEKLQGDIRRLKDYIAYKVDHAADERDQYRASGVPRALDQELLLDAPAGRGDDALALALSDEFKGEHGGGAGHGSGPRNEATSIRYEALQLEVGDLRERLDRSEAESAVLIGRIVAEKEALTGDRELLLEQLNQARADHGAAEETIANLRAAVADANITAKVLPRPLSPTTPFHTLQHLTAHPARATAVRHERPAGQPGTLHRARARPAGRLPPRARPHHRPHRATARRAPRTRRPAARRGGLARTGRGARRGPGGGARGAGEGPRRADGRDERHRRTDRPGAARTVRSQRLPYPQARSTLLVLLTLFPCLVLVQVEALRERDVEREIALERILVLEVP